MGLNITVLLLAVLCRDLHSIVVRKGLVGYIFSLVKSSLPAYEHRFFVSLSCKLNCCRSF